jgi:hypothetical protein
MSIKARNFQHDLQIEFLKSLHDEKTKAQGQRATYIASKFAFISGLFGLGALKTDAVDFSWLLVSLISNWALWKSHQNQIKRLDDLAQQPFKAKTS